MYDTKSLICKPNFFHPVASNSKNLRVGGNIATHPNYAGFDNKMKTIKQLLKLADQGDIESKFELGYRLAFGKKTFKNPPWKEIFKYWKPAAESGHLRAMFYVGVCYDRGYGIKKNIPLAFDWYLKAANLGHRDSQYNIGYFYDTGELVRKNYTKKIYWYSLAAKAGLTDAQRDLGYSYFMGEGVKKDNLKAVYWYKKAATLNDNKALYNLGLCYRHGDGVKQSNRWAKFYFSKAIKFGHKEAKGQLKSLVSN